MCQCDVNLISLRAVHNSQKMSTSKGNIKRTRPQKHQNRTAFKNNLHDTSVQTKFINSIQPHGICLRCKDIIEWKIKYKKYKPLTAPKKCVRCEQKCVKQAYHMMCGPCAKTEKVCAKCGKQAEVSAIVIQPINGDVLHHFILQVVEPQTTTAAEDEELKQVLKSLSERKRRTLLR